MRILPRTLRWAAIGAMAALAACGGGGDAPDTSAAPAPTPGATALSTCQLPDFVATAMARINQWRASGADCGTQGRFAATTPLAWSNTLTRAADTHSLDMVAHDLFSHTGSDGSEPGQRITAAGYAWRAWGENIAAGQATVDAVVDGWIDSDGHCANLMNPAFSEVGLACVSGTASTTYRTYWTMELAAPR